MSEIQIAGAGAGKTYQLASKSIQCYKKLKDHKKIYAITYTNSARQNITDNIVNQMGSVPTAIVISTVHSFLLNEIIYPFSKFITGKWYNKAISIPLPNKPSLKNYKLNFLNEKNIIHNEQVYNKAFSVLNKKRKSKSLKNKIDLVYSHLTDSIDSILIDEAQDLDSDALSIFSILSEVGIYVYIVGDPKQAIKYPNSFNDFVLESKQNPNCLFSVLDNVNSTRRIPKEHLELSNTFCPKDQEQYSENSTKGVINYLFTTDKDFCRLYKELLQVDNLTFIRQCNDRFSTNNYKNVFILPERIKSKLEKCVKRRFIDFQTFLKVVEQELFESSIEKSPSTAINIFTKKYMINLSSQEYAELITTLEGFNNDEKEFELISIDKAKGLEANNCLFVIDKVMAKYLFKVNLNKNKEHNRLYVALTRSRKNLILAFDLSSIKEFEKDYICEKMKELGIDKFNFEEWKAT